LFLVLALWYDTPSLGFEQVRNGVLGIIHDDFVGIRGTWYESHGAQVVFIYFFVSRITDVDRRPHLIVRFIPAFVTYFAITSRPALLNTIRRSDSSEEIPLLRSRPKDTKKWSCLLFAMYYCLSMTAYTVHFPIISCPRRRKVDKTPVSIS